VDGPDAVNSRERQRISRIEQSQASRIGEFL
jgi:hypothetical protein